jgi:hypothetical protein
MENSYLKSLDNIKTIFKDKYNINIDTNYPYYKQLTTYEELRNILLYTPCVLNKKSIVFIDNIIKELQFEKNINCVKYLNKNAINEIIMMYMYLKKTLYSNPDTEVGKYKRSDIERVIKNSYILPIVLLKKQQYSRISAVADNRYITYCPFHDGKKLSFSVTEDKGKFHCFNKHCAKSGNVINYLENITDMNFLSIIETLAKAYDILLPSRSKTYEDIELVKAIKTMVKDELYLSLVEESFKRQLINIQR